MSEQDEEMEWFVQGFDAFQRGEPFESCPDKASNPLRADRWQQGWLAGRAGAKGSPFDLND
jgi:hypothetical protein